LLRALPGRGSRWAGRKACSVRHRRSAVRRAYAINASIRGTHKAAPQPWHSSPTATQASGWKYHGGVSAGLAVPLPLSRCGGTARSALQVAKCAGKTPPTGEGVFRDWVPLSAHTRLASWQKIAAKLVLRLAVKLGATVRTTPSPKGLFLASSVRLHRTTDKLHRTPPNHLHLRKRCKENGRQERKPPSPKFTTQNPPEPQGLLGSQGR
jgi:hypothetical protein